MASYSEYERQKLLDSLKKINADRQAMLCGEKAKLTVGELYAIIDALTQLFQRTTN
jgi:hypothetical protein